MNNRFATVNASRTLKVVGVVLILSFFLDFLILLFPFQPTNKRWQIDLATALVDRGIVPMVGLGMLFAGSWIDSTDDVDRPPVIDLRFPALIVSSILGLLFLLIVPLHVNNVNQARAQTVDLISKDADVKEGQLKTQLSQVQERLNNDKVKAALEQQKSQIKAQFTDLIKDDQKYKQALDNPNIPQGQKDLLKKFKANPQELDKFIAEQSDPQQQAKQQITRIREGKEQAEQQAQQGATKSGLRVGMSSLLLSIGYIIIGWTGLRGMGGLQSAKRTPATR